MKSKKSLSKKTKAAGKIIINDRQFDIHKHDVKEDVDASKNIVLLSLSKSKTSTTGLLESAKFTNSKAAGLLSPHFLGDTLIDTFDKQYGSGYSPRFGRFLLTDARINLIDFPGWHLTAANYIAFNVFMGELTDARIPDGAIVSHALVTFKFILLSEIPRVRITAGDRVVNVRFTPGQDSISFYVDNNELRGRVNFEVHVPNTSANRYKGIYLEKVDLYRSIQIPPLSTHG